MHLCPPPTHRTGMWSLWPSTFSRDGMFEYFFQITLCTCRLESHVFTTLCQILCYAGVEVWQFCVTNDWGNLTTDQIKNPMLDLTLALVLGVHVTFSAKHDSKQFWVHSLCSYWSLGRIPYHTCIRYYPSTGRRPGIYKDCRWVTIGWKSSKCTRFWADALNVFWPAVNISLTNLLLS